MEIAPAIYAPEPAAGRLPDAGHRPHAKGPMLVIAGPWVGQDPYYPTPSRQPAAERAGPCPVNWRSAPSAGTRPGSCSGGSTASALACGFKRRYQGGPGHRHHPQPVPPAAGFPTPAWSACRWDYRVLNEEKQRAAAEPGVRRRIRSRPCHTLKTAVVGTGYTR